MFGDVSDGDDAMGGQSSVEVGPISASQAPDHAVTIQVERLVASFEWLASMDLESLHTATVPSEICVWVHEK